MASQDRIAVVGGGIVGAATVGLLARAGASVTLIDPGPAPQPPAGPFELRVSAVSPGSAAILGEAGAAPALSGNRACEYARMVVEDRHPGARIEFEAPAFGLERLGTIVENEAIRAALWHANASQAIELLSDRVVGFEASASDVRLGLASGAEHRFGLVVASDGAGSVVRRLIGTVDDTWTYNQSAVVCVVRCQRPNPGTAWQRFLDTGPLAFLPLPDGTSSIVWTLPQSLARELLALDDRAFAARLGDAAGEWLGEVLDTGPRASFPLAMRLGDRLAGPRAVLLGDAAHTVHPLAGQGVNLGLADAAALVETLSTGGAGFADPGDPRLLARWARWRRSESQLMALGIHGLGALFSPGWLGPLRRFGLGLAGRSWLAREAFVTRAAGLGPGAPQLARGASVKTLPAG